ncbi:hypothetical protein [Tsukamurella paurometabola]|uniref:Uncharacterized protein n=1 Tax=Tsukamurella paurometabola TaxID=2061 RepID=A0A3P8LCV4_TSUPA|nr:hypothetical protein [Tsukamurella paurometabola]MBS4103056.1 hypothetical protein [Tsukamurella paurometabola]UEA84872.1 hypothetical protein LK411_08675 [Tsukamurella paurometabola]VDR37462.1 Uncharacterised protein [Tsukamurella paurometabola]
MNPVIDGGTALGGRLAWVHVAHGDRSQVRFYAEGEYAGTATAVPTVDTEVIGVDYDVVYVRYGRDIARFRLDETGAVIALDAVPASVLAG